MTKRNRYYRVVLEKQGGYDGPRYLFGRRKDADDYARRMMRDPVFSEYKRARIERVGDGVTLDPRTGEYLNVTVLAYTSRREVEP